ncbi:GNAT family N-acetyltransferase [Pseudomonas frederiksbergensis]|uniref:GNAT family N-acetyltransferase n=1 Tax=Pseudomonas frederiksbergensis TaxID=104087 RepID=A0A423HS37_9PSED|nr:GNAT family N-acetyltransferase [Pseudomonas frederiksbergensis]RON15878.1 GNAT family N-acetyltransferase [Pseudomonas frederiksbergensis]
MKPVRIRTLQSTDAEALLAFELDNREWFERFIDARDAAFYSLQGVTDHIAAYLSDLAAGIWHPFVIEDPDGKIVGRANLKGIDMPEGSAEVGYRIAQSACEQGLATLAVRHLIQEAQLHWNLKQLVANVYAGNIGSAKVLERCGFLIDPISRQEGTEHEYRFDLSI